MLTALVIAILVGMIARSGKGPGKLGISDGILAPCPPAMNCVSSDALSDKHRIEPFVASESADEEWTILLSIVESMPRTQIVTSTSDYLHAEVTMPLIPFVDDLEFNLRRNDGVIAVRSVSRAGYWDLGVNRRRVETIRKQIGEDGDVTK